MIQFDEHIFQMGWNHQLANKVITPMKLNTSTDKMDGTGRRYFYVWLSAYVQGQT